MSYKSEEKQQKILQYANRVLNITDGSNEEIISEAIAQTREFFSSLGAKTRLSEYDIDLAKLPKIIDSLKSLSS